MEKFIKLYNSFKTPTVANRVVGLKKNLVPYYEGLGKYTDITVQPKELRIEVRN